MVPKPTAKFYLAGNYAITMFIGFLSIKILLNGYSIEQYTLLLILQATIGLAIVIDFGLMNKLIVNIPLLENKWKINRYLEVHFIIFKRVLITSSITFLFICFIIMHVNNNHEILNIWKISYVLLLFSIIIGIVNYLKNLYDALGWFIEFSVINTLYSILSFALLIYITINGYAVEYILFSYILSGIILIIFIFYRLKKANIILPLKKLSINEEYNRKDYWSVNMQFASIIGFSIDPIFKLVLSLFGYSSLIITFEIAKRVTNGISGIYSNTIRILLPQFVSENILTKGKSEIVSIINEQYKYIYHFIILTYGCLSIIFYFMGIYYNDYHLSKVITILSFSEIIIIGSGLFYLILLSSSYFKKILFIQIQNIFIIMILGNIFCWYTANELVFASFIIALGISGIYSYYKVKSLFNYDLNITSCRYFRKYLYLVAISACIILFNSFSTDNIIFYEIISGISILTVVFKKNTIAGYFVK